MAYNTLLLEVSDGIGVLTINRPKALNALNSEVISELNTCLEEVKNNDDIKVLILTGSGEKSFVAGADISEMLNFDVAGGRSFALNAKKAFDLLETMDKPTIAAVNGFALGGGCEISMACDITVAAENAVFGQPETGLGITPGFGGTQRLARLVGKKKAKELIFTCDKVKAPEAKELGLVNTVVPQAELMDYCKEMAKKIIKNAPLAVAYSKQAINNGLDVDLSTGVEIEASLFGMCFATEDQKEGMSAFVEKRPNNGYKGK